MADETTTIIDTDTSHSDDTNLVKHLRETIKNKDKELAEAKRTAEESRNSENEILKDTAEKVKRLEFESTISQKFPAMSDKKEDVWKIMSEKQGLTQEDAVAIVLGQTVMSSSSTPTPSPSFGTQIGVQVTGSKQLTDLSDAELAELAGRELFGA